MLSKLLRPAVNLKRALLVVRKARAVPSTVVRSSGHFIPPDQYDVPIPKRLHLTYALRVHWEIIPLFLVTAFSFTLCFLSCIWAILYKPRDDLPHHQPAPAELLQADRNHVGVAVAALARDAGRAGQDEGSRGEGLAKGHSLPQIVPGLRTTARSKL
ncbi:unnamed protein product [Leptidea sinapis]|uniref:Uncharacterized protein n=1 Tax=Leptidea sinapis TaxID=189913 RepID=A0A5E4QK78_9NEOP|nr:unnamed protein product [Leptidea sinapis]